MTLGEIISRGILAFWRISKGGIRVPFFGKARVLSCPFPRLFPQSSDRSGRVALCPLYVLAMEPLLRRLRDEQACPALRGVPLIGRVRAKVSAYADDITVFLSSRQDILAVKKAEDRY